MDDLDLVSLDFGLWSLSLGCAICLRGRFSVPGAALHAVGSPYLDGSTTAGFVVSNYTKTKFKMIIE